MIGLILWLICVLLIAGAVLGVVKALLACQPFASFQPYANVVYALIVLLIVLVCVSAFYAGPNGGLEWARPPKW